MPVFRCAGGSSGKHVIFGQLSHFLGQLRMMDQGALSPAASITSGFLFSELQNGTAVTFSQENGGKRD
jgi:hypothetical protein